MYEKKYFKSARFEAPIISVGNLSVGGTGKSPHVEYLIQLLQPHFMTAVLSRGFGREGREMTYVENNHTAKLVGDEPLMIKLKRPDTIVAVGIERLHCIPRMLGDVPAVDVIILDDAYQHRSVRAGLSILLTDYSDPFYEDFCLPAGRLRERRKHTNRADIIVVTKCPDTISEEEKNAIIQHLKPAIHQHVYFSTLSYGAPYPLFPELNSNNSIIEQNEDGYTLKTSLLKQKEKCLLVCGIAKPESLIAFLKTQYKEVYTQLYSDHHAYDEHDVEVMKSAYFDIGKDTTDLVTTEKDAVRLLPFTNWFLQNKMQLIVQGIQVKMLDSTYGKFNDDVFSYVHHDLKKYKPERYKEQEKIE